MDGTLISKVNPALICVYGSAPYGWLTEDKVRDIYQMLLLFPQIRGNHPPLTTYLLFARSCLRFDLTTNYNAVFSEKMKNSFVEHLRSLEDEARVQVELDDGNFKAEVAAFGSIENAVKSPHLDITPLYRYMAAIQQGMLSCVTDELVTASVQCLRVNPYLYYAYGPGYTELMPIAWEGI